MSAALLRCRVFKGMFSDELAIRYEEDERAPAFFVPRSKVVQIEHDSGSVCVQVFRNNGTSWAVLPTEFQTVIRIRDQDLVPQ